MTQSAKIIAATLLFSNAICINISAQQDIASAASTNIKRSELVTDHTPPVVPPGKTKTGFQALFPHAVNPSWSVINDDCYYVSFLNNGRKANASFTTKGKMNYCVTDCAMENFPASFRKIIEKEYAGYSLLKGTQINAYGAVSYQAVLENSGGFKTIKFTDDGVEEIAQVKK